MNDVAVAVRFALACATIAFVLGGFWFVVRALRRAGPARGRTVVVLETVYLPNGASLHAIRAGPRTLVIGRSGSAISTICEIDAGALPVDREA